ncbi:hypothetical protein SAY86_017478 [Trapa natans]|uniref:beta-carotene 3-hydroxylase n=1 Tax=Trapa natans TaxID=22666 RepID=A0AAN7R2R2_TRANT|nr:hypothetical protein SAY86_017478 [Trapa natans]
MPNVSQEETWWTHSSLKQIQKKKHAASLSFSQQALFAHSSTKSCSHYCPYRKKARIFTVYFVLDQRKETVPVEGPSAESSDGSSTKIEPVLVNSRMAERLAKKRSERIFHFHGGEVPLSEMVSTFALSVGFAVGMEFWARWAHRALWHASSLWHMHESHHRPREGPFELNDVFAIINAVPAIALLSYGFFHKWLVPGLCFGAGLGITVFGMAYMFDGLVHRRFPVGPIANVPYFRRVAPAHQLHHSDKFNGVPQLEKEMEQTAS